MVKPINKVYTLQAPSQAYFANDVTGLVWTITTNAISGGQAYKIALKNNSATDHSAKTVVFTGPNPDGRTQSETINMPAGNATVFTTLYYSGLATAVPSATIGADTMDIGFTSAFATPTIPVSFYATNTMVSVDYTGTMTYSVKTTCDNVQTKTPPFYWQDAGAPFIAATTPQNSAFLASPRALAVEVASYSGTPTFEFSILQN